MNYFEERLAKEGFRFIAGVDEAGRGCLAGPLVSAAVILYLDCIPEGIRDSKKLSPKVRETLFNKICDQSLTYHITLIEPSEIDRIGLQKANLESFHLAIQGLKRVPDFILSDWYKVDSFDCPSLSFKKGEQKSINIAAASILAKVYRDRIMAEFDVNYPGYGFAAHKGYGTSEHRAALTKKGPSPIHRLSFSGVCENKRLFNERF